jgi:hypothetical protein
MVGMTAERRGSLGKRRLKREEGWKMRRKERKSGKMEAEKRGKLGKYL